MENRTVEAISVANLTKNTLTQIQRNTEAPKVVTAPASTDT